MRRRRRRESDTTPAILFLSSAATAFVAMTTQADDLIAVTFECRSLKEPVTPDRGADRHHIDEDRPSAATCTENTPAMLLEI